MEIYNGINTYKSLTIRVRPSETVYLEGYSAYAELTLLDDQPHEVFDVIQMVARIDYSGAHLYHPINLIKTEKGYKGALMFNDTLIYITDQSRTPQKTQHRIIINAPNHIKITRQTLKEKNHV